MRTITGIALRVGMLLLFFSIMMHASAMEALVNTTTVESQPFTLSFTIRHAAEEPLDISGFFLDWNGSRALTGDSLMSLINSGSAQAIPNSNQTAYEIRIPGMVFPAGEHTITVGTGPTQSHSSTFLIITDAAASDLTPQQAGVAIDRLAVLHAAVSARAMGIASNAFTTTPFDPNAIPTQNENTEMNWWLTQLQAADAQGIDAMKVLSDYAESLSAKSRQAPGDTTIQAGHDLYNFGKFLSDLYGFAKREIFGSKGNTGQSGDPVIAQMDKLTDAQLDALYKEYADDYYSFELGSGKPNTHDKYTSGRAWLNDIKIGVHDQHFRTMKTYLMQSMSSTGTYEGNVQADLGKHYQETAVLTGKYAFKIAYQGLKKTPTIGEAIKAFEKVKGAVDNLEKMQKLVNHLMSQNINIPSEIQKNLQALGLQNINSTTDGQAIGTGLKNTDATVDGQTPSGFGTIQPGTNTGNEIASVMVVDSTGTLSVTSGTSGGSVSVNSGSNLIAMVSQDGHVDEQSGINVTAGQSVTVDPSFPTTAPLTANASDVTFEMGQTVTLTGSATGGTAPYEYGWYDGDTLLSSSTTLTIPPATYGTTGVYVYTFGVRDATGTVATTTAKLTLTTSSHKPVISITGNTTISAGQALTLSSTVTGGSGSYAYGWMFDNATIATTPNLSLDGAQTTTPGSYLLTLYITDNSTQLTSSTNVTITITAPTATPISVSLGSSRTIAYMSSATITPSISGGSGSYTYAWKSSGTVISNDSSLTINNDGSVPTGAYTITLKVTDSTGATASDTISVTLVAPTTTTLSVSLGSSRTIAYMNSATITPSISGGSGSYTYAWSASGSTISTGSSLTINNDGSIAAGTYVVTLTVTDTTGATGNATVNVTLSAPTTTSLSVSLGSSRTIAYMSSATITPSISGGSGSYTYAWSASGSTISTGSSLTINNDGSIAAGTYTITLTVTDTTGATGSATVNVTISAPTTTPSNGLGFPMSLRLSINQSGYYPVVMAVSSSGGMVEQAASFSPTSWCYPGSSGELIISRIPSGAAGLIVSVIGAGDALPTIGGQITGTKGSVTIPTRTVSGSNPTGIMICTIDPDGVVDVTF